MVSEVLLPGLCQRWVRGPESSDASRRPPHSIHAQYGATAEEAGAAYSSEERYNLDSICCVLL